VIINYQEAAMGSRYRNFPNRERVRSMLIAALLTSIALLPNLLTAEQVPVLHREGLMHGFLALRTLQGKKLADGEMTQVAEGNRITSKLIFRFHDGSIYEDKTVFIQEGTFRLLSDHLVQKGPSFKQTMETSIDAAKGEVTVRYKDDRGEEKVLSQKLELPPDVANGLMFTLVKDIKPATPQTTVSMLATTPKPRIVKLVISPEGEKSISSGNTRHKAVVFNVKVQIGGIAGLLARVTGKQPPDTYVWVLGGEAPAFVKSEGPLYQGGPIWRIELANPSGFP